MSATRTAGRRGRPVDSEPHGRLDALQSDPYPYYERARRTDGLARLAELDACPA